MYAAGGWGIAATFIAPAYAQHDDGGHAGGPGGGSGGHEDGDHDDGHDHEDGDEHDDGHEEGGGRGPYYHGGRDQPGHQSSGHGGHSLEDRVFRVDGIVEYDFASEPASESE